MYCIKIYCLEVTGIHNIYSIQKEAWDATAYSDCGRGCVEGVNELVRITIILYSVRFTRCKTRTSAPPLARVYIIILVYSLIKKFSGKNTTTTLLNTRTVLLGGESQEQINGYIYESMAVIYVRSGRYLLHM